MMIKQELLDAMRAELSKNNNKLDELKSQYVQLGKDIEGCNELCKAYLTTTIQLSLEMARDNEKS